MRSETAIDKCITEMIGFSLIPDSSLSDVKIYMGYIAEIGYKEGCKHISHGKQKSIVQYDKNGKYIKTHDGIRPAGITTGILFTSIQNCLSGNSKTAGGYKWKYNKI